MRVPLLIVCAVLMTAGSAQAYIMGSWSTEDAGGGLDRFILTLTPTNGETMAGFDIAIYDPTFSIGFNVTTSLFKAAKDTGSSFLLNKYHVNFGGMPPMVTDLLSTAELQDTYVVGGAFAVTGTGAYSAGWSGPLQLAEIIVPHGSITNPLTQLVVTQSDFTGFPMASRPDGSLMPFFQYLTPPPDPPDEPEPGTLTLLAAASVGLGVYGFRKRRSLKIGAINLRVPLLIVCAVLMTANSAQAYIIGSWTTEEAGSGMDRWILTVMPMGGETMAGFDIAIYDPTFSTNFQMGTLFKSTKDTGSSFLLNKSHTVAGTPPTTVTDLLVPYETADTYVIAGAFAVTGSGAYSAGWSGPLQLAEIIVPHGSITNPLTQLVVTQSDFTGDAMISRPDGSLIRFGVLSDPDPLEEPEPGTLTMLASGAIAMLFFAWRRRK